ncbi:helix-turn-helix transcriptional regulator, partial [Arenibaculum sp.]|uniref:helix-turn-helix domain-containing protein n=1 Tax=Arenibaculum sp. TaxID=2865862 RepID=UPI002E0EF1C3|nr:helix-turn-helix transcriptional regulator [Arenibaculum sp.]
MRFSPEIVRALRKDSGLTQEALAERLGMTSQAVSNIETGRNDPSANTLAALARLLDISIAAFFSDPRPLSEAQLLRQAEVILSELSERDLRLAVKLLSVIAEQQ